MERAYEVRESLRPRSGFRRFTVYVEFDEYTIEEIDVDAVSIAAAREKAREILERDYVPGGRILRTLERIGLYL